QQPAGILGIAAAEGGGAALQQLFPFTMPFGDGAAGAVAIRTGACVAAIEEQDARPDTDGELVLTVEIMVEAREKQLLDPRLAFRRARRGRLRTRKRTRQDR